MKKNIIINGNIVSWSQNEKYLKFVFIDFYAAVNSLAKQKGRKASWQIWGYKCSVKESTEQTGTALVVRDALCLPVLEGIVQLPLRY